MQNSKTQKTISGTSAPAQLPVVIILPRESSSEITVFHQCKPYNLAALCRLMDCLRQPKMQFHD